MVQEGGERVDPRDFHVVGGNFMNSAAGSGVDGDCSGLQVSDVVILNRFCLLYFLKMVLLISAKFPLMRRVKSALSAEFTATLSISTCTKRKRLWMVTYTPMTIIYKARM